MNLKDSLHTKKIQHQTMFGDTKVRSVIQDFVNMDEAIEYVSNHHGFVKTEDGKFAFEVRNISAIG